MPTPLASAMWCTPVGQAVAEIDGAVAVRFRPSHAESHARIGAHEVITVDMGTYGSPAQIDDCD
jgi:hypothetical protein